MLRRELAIALRARLPWWAAALSALLVGHGFVLALELFAAGSRSVANNALMAREFDPLAGVVRPTLGGLYLAASLLLPIVAARPIAVERERRHLASWILFTGSPIRVLLAKYVAGLASAAPLLVGPLAALGLWRALGGHLAFAETALAFAGHALYLALVVAVGTAAAAWTGSLAQAATLAVVAVLASWAIDAAEGFAALAWLGRAADWSVTTHLTPFERGTLLPGAGLWMLALTAGMLGLAWVGLRADFALRHRLALAAVVAATTVLAMKTCLGWRGGHDLTEGARMSLPAGAVRGLRTIPGPIRLTVWLDRDDSRRRQAESDVFAKLLLARGDIEIVTPLDGRSAPVEGGRDDGYGRVVVAVGARRTETYSMSRRELTTLIFEVAGRPPPDWSQPSYPGYPLVPSARARVRVGVCAYGLVPGALALAGIVLTRRRRRSS